MQDLGANSEPVATVLRKLAQEMASMRAQVLTVENALSIGSTGPALGRPQVAQLQAIDHISQTLACLEEFLASLSGSIDQSLQVNPQKAAKALTLRALSARLSNTSAPPSEPLEMGEIHLF